MKVATSQPFCLIYSLYQHEYLGYLWEPFIVQLNDRGELTLLHQSISSKNINEFAERLDDTDFELVKLIDAIQQEVVIKKFSSKKTTPTDFFLKVFDKNKGDKNVQDSICNYIESHRAKICPLLVDKRVFIMGNDGNPIREEVTIPTEPASVRFHVMRNADNTHYYPTIRHQGVKVEFQHRDAILLGEDPAWLLLDAKLYHFKPAVDGKKLKPFFHKKFIVIPKSIEEDYYRKFVSSLITLFDVYAKGFEIRSESFRPIPQLNLSENFIESATAGSSASSAVATDTDVTLTLSFNYGDHSFRFDSFTASANVSMETREDEYIFHKIQRDIPREKETIRMLRERNLHLRNGQAVLPKAEAFSWIQDHYEPLLEQGFVISQSPTDSKRYFLGYSSLQLSIHENRDWFDIFAVVRFGEYEIPFLQLKQLILDKKREFTLPNGEVAVIPESWFSQYSELFAFANDHDDEDHLILHKHHISLVQELQEESLAATIINRKLEKLRDFEEIEAYPLPQGLNGTLRPYQKAGYDWLRFLNQYQFGGCLADDMGLGKTLQTLSLLQSQYENGAKEASLIVMPTSLLYNWQLEIKKFTPMLRVLVYTGTYREKNIDLFNQYDIVLTSYGIVRIDVELLQRYPFHYIILDESQAIKNPGSNISKALSLLQSRFRLILSGTPLENSTMDLWSQMNFVNPGLLGSQSFFRNEFQIPIEKRGDEKKTQRLYSIIKPFMLRRHKSQVATELPEKVESIQYCAMSEEQEKAYEEAKSYYRNMILQHIEEEGIAKSQMVVLQGLTRLRQLANHPRMVDSEYEFSSGKLEEVLAKIETVVGEKHKILIFSQFVKHLDLVKSELEERGFPYAYLDGNTQDRQGQVELFQTNEQVPIFLISLKAGGLGLNLTAADYVFILDPWWNPAIEAQAIDRAHRIGQDKTVFTYKFISQNTVEEKILALQHSKQRLASELITTEDTFVKSLSKEDVLSLLE
ncbi:DEAD/DEAH box helicase [Siphonobacter curvatus]|uniref:Helicase SNF2 n=1 Tax=Siphonobacter curvatus TaxID=2094562 RepID=A0A2S7IKD0_9BACT|nr:SNF2-related protein [Siphonobacter curvatus]PQA58213.1 helicase SNF2 [Siphonobacter curvatus]